MGGGFGARGDFYAASMAALLTYKTNKPVKIVYSREESLMSSCKAPQYYMKYKTGATKEGKLVAMEAEFLLSGGSWAPYMNPDMMMFGRLPMSPVHHSTGPYHIPNVHVTAREVATNHPRATPLRGTVGSPVAFACESQMDKLAIKLNMDPIEFRLKNVLEIGSETHYGQIMEESVGARECFEALKPHFEEAKKWASLNPVDDDWKRGVGFAAGWRSIIKSGMNLLLSAAEILETGKVRISVGAVEKGQGSMTALAQIAAQELGLAWGQIEMLMGDTYLAPYPVETNSSKVTIMVGAAVQNAANALKVSIKEAAAEMLETDTSNILIKDGYIFNEQFPDESLTLNALASYMKEKDKQVKTEGSFIWPPDEKKDPTKNLYVMGDRPNIVYAFTGQVSQVEVNTKTGKVRVPKAAHCSDPGTVINPRALEGQIEGGMTFGMGFAISEEWIPGKSLSYKDYKVTTIRDVYEEIDVLFAGGGTLSCGPFGAKGAGEMSDVAPVPSIINGIVSACGVRVLDLPASPDRVKGLLEKETLNSS
jgi:CO/xanthine dehydrogenase Mo-binding subunit